MPDEGTINYPLEAADIELDQRKEQLKMFGPLFPGPKIPKLKTNEAKEYGNKWAAWVERVIRDQEVAMANKRLHWARHRHFAQSRQWISTRDGRTWRELNSDANTVRVTLDQIGPAIDFRLGIMTEQRPGFRTEPLGLSMRSRKAAEAQQRVAEYYAKRLRLTTLLSISMANAHTDGVAFIHVFVDKHAGPKRREVMLIDDSDDRYNTLEAAGYHVNKNGQLEIPIDAKGNKLPAEAAVRTVTTGDIGSRVVMASEVWFDAESKSVNGPIDRAKWCIIRRVRDLQTARLETGDPELESDTPNSNTVDPVLDTSDVGTSYFGPSHTQNGLPVFPGTRQRREDGVYEYLVFVAPNAAAGFPRGMWRRVIGRKIVAGRNSLPGGKIPLARVTDGSRDPEMFPRPVMANWLPDQLAINALASKLIEHARIFGTGRVMAQQGTMIKETYSQIVGSVLEYTGSKPEMMSGIRVSGDVWSSLQFFIKQLENKTGWNDLARGQVTGSGSFQDVSGRALLGARELFERTFGPMIRAAADGATEWSELIVDYVRYLFDEPRIIPIVGRPDLATALEAKDFGEDNMVYVDPETMMPLPLALRNQMLFDLMQNGLITQDEYRRRAPFSEIRSVHMGGLEQYQRAQLVNVVIKERADELVQLEPTELFEYGDGLPVFWQDDAAVHMNTLQELILDDELPTQVRELAQARWAVYDGLQRSKMPDPNTGMVMPPPPVVKGVPDVILQAFAAGEQPGQPEGFDIPANEFGPAGGSAPGAGFAAASPTPELSPTTQAAQQLQAQPLGTFGSAEAAAQAQQER